METDGAAWLAALQRNFPPSGTLAADVDALFAAHGREVTREHVPDRARVQRVVERQVRAAGNPRDGVDALTFEQRQDQRRTRGLHVVPPRSPAGDGSGGTKRKTPAGHRPAGVWSWSDLPATARRPRRRARLRRPRRKVGRRREAAARSRGRSSRAELTRATPATQADAHDSAPAAIPRSCPALAALALHRARPRRAARVARSAARVAAAMRAAVARTVDRDLHGVVGAAARARVRRHSAGARAGAPRAPGTPRGRCAVAAFPLAGHDAGNSAAASAVAAFSPFRRVRGVICGSA